MFERLEMNHVLKKRWISFQQFDEDILHLKLIIPLMIFNQGQKVKTYILKGQSYTTKSIIKNE